MTFEAYARDWLERQNFSKTYERQHVSLLIIYAEP